MTHKNYGPDRFSRFDVYWIQTDKQTDKPNVYIDDMCKESKAYKANVCLQVTPVFVSKYFCTGLPRKDEAINTTSNCINKTIRRLN